MKDGGLIFTSPTNWSTPQGTSSTAGYVTASTTGVFATSVNPLDVATGWSDNSLFISLSATSSIKKEGTASLLASVTASVGTGQIYYNFGSAQNWSEYTKLSFWIRSNIALTTGDVDLLASESADLGSSTRFDLPTNISFATDTWTHVVVDLPSTSSTARDAVLSYGFEIPIALLSNFYFDNVTIGPSVPIFSGQTAEVKFISLGNGSTTTFTYGSGGGASGVSVGTTTGVTQIGISQKVDSSGSHASLGSLPTVTVNFPSIQFASTSSEGSEASSSIQISLQISTSTNATTTIQYSVVASSTAIGSGTDYTLLNGTSTISAGATTASISVTITDDALVESSETIVLQLTTPVNASLGTTTQHIFTIVDNEAAPILSFTSSSHSSTESATSVIILLEIGTTSTQTISLAFASSGTATYGSDYTISTTTATISGGQSSTSISISIINDSLDEADETIILTISTSTNATIGSTSTLIHTITDDDDAPTIFFVSSTSSYTESSATATLVLQLSATSSQSITIQYRALSTSTATGNGTDFTLANGTSTISAGATTTSIQVTLTDDSLDEDDELIYLNIHTSTNVNLGSTSTHTLTLTDNDAAPSIQFTLATSTGSEATATATLEISLSASSSKTTTVQYTVQSSSTATGSGTDYTLANSTSTISAGNSTTTISISITNDATYEGNEIIVLQLGSPSNASLGSNTQHVHTTIDDEGPDTTAPSISSLSHSVNNTTGTITWTTDEAASSQIEYNTIPTSYPFQTSESDTSPRVTSHSVTIGRLESCTTYYYRVKSKDSSANTATSSPSLFTTGSCTGNTSVISVTSTEVATSSSQTITHDTLTLGVTAGYGTTTATFQIKKINTTTFASAARVASSLGIIGSHTYHLEALISSSTAQTSFASFLTIAIQYEDSEISNYTESTLKILRYDTSWNDLPSCTVNTSANTVTCSTTQFSDFALIGTPISSSGSSSGGGGGSIPSYLLASLLPQKTLTACINTTSTSYLQTLDENAQLGTTSNTVLELQKFLNANNYSISMNGPGSKGQETNYFGKRTQQALIKFQESQGLKTERAILGTETRSLINKALLNSTNSSSSSVIMCNESLCPEYLTSYIKYGSNNNPNEVKKLQRFLREYEHFEQIEHTGIYDLNTKNAVIEFQERYLSDILAPWGTKKATGYVFQTTKRAINKLHCEYEFKKEQNLL